MYTVGGLFAGVGGIEIGFEKAGFEISWANEFDKYACITYRHNHKEHNLIEGDIHDIDPSALLSVDILTGGFPCQAFSIAGYQNGFDDPRGNLFFEIVRLIKGLPEKPKVLFLENVKNLVGHDKKNTFKVIRDYLHNLGYSVFWDILNTAVYTDLPQNRERTFIICFRDEYNWEFKNDREKTASHYFSSVFPPIKRKKLKHIREILEKEKVDDKFYYTESSYMYKELVNNIKSRDTIYQWRRVYVRENKNDMCPTLTANMGTGGHNVPLILDDWGIRKLTPWECFKFQGYDSKFKLPKSEVANSQLYKQAGNSVTVPLVQKIAGLIRDSLDYKYRTRYELVGKQ